jgi:hypothetical protein
VRAGQVFSAIQGVGFKGACQSVVTQDTGAPSTDIFLSRCKCAHMTERAQGMHLSGRAVNNEVWLCSLQYWLQSLGGCGRSEEESNERGRATFALTGLSLISTAAPFSTVAIAADYRLSRSSRLSALEGR